MQSIIIGLGYRAGSGKDTVADLLRKRLEEAGLVVQRFKFAHNVREAAKLFLGPSDLDVYHPDFKTTPLSHLQMTGGQLLQKIGHGMRELLGDDCWINSLARNIDNWSIDMAEIPVQRIAIISDVRYLNEAAWIESRNGTTIRVDRFVPQDDHPSETQGEDIFWDTRIDNTKDLNSLNYQVEAFVSLFLDGIKDRHIY